MSRIEKRNHALNKLSNLIKSPSNSVVIHYSCESFYDRPNGASPRITSIAVRNLDNGQTCSFSIHQVAEKDGVTNPDEITRDYDQYEKKMLSLFYDFVEKNSSKIWVHWNMRDINFGFPALAHRAGVLKVKSHEIHENNLVDLSRMLVDIYGVGYIGHPRLGKLLEKNNISDLGFMGGESEAAAFDQSQYVKLHQSTLRKTDVLANILERTVNGTLKTNATLREIYGGYFHYIIHLITTHWIFYLLGIIGSIASIIGLYYAL